MTTETEEITKLVHQAAHVPDVHEVGDKLYIVVPSGWEAKEVNGDEYGLKLNKPRYVAAAPWLQTTQSLIDYANRFKGENSVIFADINTSAIVAAIDYHGDGVPEHIAHKAALVLSHSIEWIEWNKISGKLMEQLDFARFIEENGADVAAPDGAELLECVRDLQAYRKVNFTKAVRTSSDNENFEFSEETQAKSKTGGIEIPTKFKLSIPVYFGEEDTEVFAFLRWRLQEGNLLLGVQLHRAEHVRQAVFKKIVGEIAEQTDCPTVFGKLG